MALMITVDGSKINSCLNGLTQLSQNELKKLKDVHLTGSALATCKTMEIKIKVIKADLFVATQQMQHAKQGIDVQLKSTHQQKAKIQQMMRQKNSEIVQLRGKLQAQQGTLSTLNNDIGNLERSISAKRRKKKDLEKTAVATGIIGGVASIFTLGASGYAAAAVYASTAATVLVLVNEMDSAQNRANTLRNECSGVKTKVSHIRNRISAKEQELNAYTRQFNNLGGKKGRLEDSIKQVGKLIVNIGNAVKYTKEVQIKCESLIGNIGNVKELLDIPDLMKDELNSLQINMNAAGKQLLCARKMLKCH